MAVEGHRCARHDDRPAHAVCERCGDFVCLECLSPAEGRLYCAGCLERLLREGALAFQQSAHSPFPVVALVLGIVSIALEPLPFLGLPTAVAAILTGARSVRRIRRHPGLVGLGMSWTGVGFGLLGLAANVFWLALHLGFRPLP